MQGGSGKENSPDRLVAKSNSREETPNSLGQTLPTPSCSIIQMLYAD